MDVAYPLSSNGGVRHDLSTDLLIYLGDGTGNFTKGQTVTVEEEPGSTLAADFNKDGHTSILLAPTAPLKLFPSFSAMEMALSRSTRVSR